LVGWLVKHVIWLVNHVGWIGLIKTSEKKHLGSRM